MLSPEVQRKGESELFRSVLSGGRNLWRNSFDLADESFRLIEKIKNGAVIRVQMFEASDLSLEGCELPLQLMPVRGNEASPYPEGNVLWLAAWLEKSAHSGWREASFSRDCVDGLGVCCIVPPGGVEE